MDRKLSRRDVLQRSAAFGTLAAFAAACGKEQPPALSCTDTTALTPSELMIRTSLAYVDASVQPGKMCANCLQFLPSTPNACGACKVVKGPINPSGYCRSFAPKLT